MINASTAGNGGLIKKLAEVMAAVERVPKRGRNAFHGYDYATESDIVETVRRGLAERHVMLLPSVLSVTREPVGEKGNVLTTANMQFVFVDGDCGEQIAATWYGCGTDKEDKGLYKAMTGGEKYFLLKTFLMPTGDDPEHDAAAPKGYQTEAPTAERPAPVGGRPNPSDQNGGDAGHSNYHTTQRATGEQSALPPDAVYIQRVDCAPTRNPNVTKTLITLSTGEVVSTINSQLAALCEQCCQDQVAVRVETKASKWGVGLVAVHRVDAGVPENAYAGMLNDDEPPFVWILPFLGMLGAYFV